MARAKRILASLLALASVAGCSFLKPPGSEKPGLLSRWERELSIEKPAVDVPWRGLAEAGAPACLKDRLAPDELRSFIRQADAEREGPRLKGKRHGFDLARFTRPNAEFLSRSGALLPLQEVNVSDCADAICVLTRIYKAEAPALKHYAWYLRSGYLLAANDNEPHYSFGGKMAYSDFLFSDAELSAFYRVSWMLNDTMLGLPSLQSIHRMPKGAKASDRPQSCGLAFGNKWHGNILLMDRCLISRPGHDSDIHVNITHEITHRADAYQGPKNSKFLSETAAWLELSGWKRETAEDKAKKATKTSWVREGKHDGFVTDYAKTNPTEDFAETVAYFRHMPDDALSKAPKKSAFVANLLFEGRTFDTKGLGVAYESILSSRLSASVLPLAQECAEAPHSGEIVSESSAEALVALPLHGVSEGLASCIRSGVLARIQAGIDELRATELEACDYLSTRESALRSRVLARANAELEKVALEQDSLLPRLAAARELRDALELEHDPRETYRACRAREDASLCYERSLEDAFDRHSLPYSRALGDALALERANYLAVNSFTKVAARTTALFRTVLEGSEALVVAAAERRWHECMAQPAELDGALPITRPFTGGTRFVQSGILTCVNESAFRDLDAIKDRHAARMGITGFDADATLFVRELLLPGYIGALNRQLERDARAEEAERALAKPPAVEAMKAAALRDLEWVGLAIDAVSAFPSCMPVAVKAKTNPFPARFASIAETRLTWATEACSAVVLDHAVAASIQANAKKFKEAADREWALALQELESAVLTRAKGQATTCIAKYPGSKQASKRKTCLTAEWPTIEEWGLSDWGATESGRVSPAHQRDASDHIKKLRSALQKAAVEAMELAVKQR